MDKYNFVRLHDPFIYFCNNAKLYIKYRNGYLNLIDYLPLLKSGYAVGQSLLIFMIMYTRINNLRDMKNLAFVKVDDLLNKSFNSDIFINGQNTFDILKLGLLNFDSEQISVSHFAYIYKINSVETTILDDDLINNLIIEYKLIKKFAKIIKINNDSGKHNINIVDILSCIEIKHLNYLRKDNYMDLLINILKTDLIKIEELLVFIDPRDYNNEAFKLANTIGNDVVKLIIDNINKRVHIEQQIFDKYLNLDILKHYYKLIY